MTESANAMSYPEDAYPGSSVRETLITCVNVL